MMRPTHRLTGIAAALLLPAILSLLPLLFASTACVAQTASLTWAKYLSCDGSFSFHYPLGWQVEEGESAIAVKALSGDELNARMWAHQNMLWANQNTFNHWRWCMGYTRTPFGY